MTDRVSAAVRSGIMSKIKSRHTTPELLTAAMLHFYKIDFEPYPDIVGHPDFLVRPNIALFCDGDFWHGRKGIRIPDTPFWAEKIRRNRARDRKVNGILLKSGYAVVRLWGSRITENPDVVKIAIKGK